MTGCLPAQEWEIRTPNHRLIFDIIKFLASAWRTKGIGAIPTGAEPNANRFSPARMRLFGPNSAPNSGQISPIEMLAVPGVRIRPSPPYSLACFPTLWRSDEIGAWGANNERPWKRRLPTAAHNADSPRFVSVAKEFGATTKRCGNGDRVAKRAENALI